MKKSELYILSTAQIGISLSFTLMFIFLPLHLIENIFYSHPLKEILGFSVITISFMAGAITYIFAGTLSDRTRTRIGKRRPYFLMIIPSAIFYILLGLPSGLLSFYGFPSPTSIIPIFITMTIFGVIYGITHRLIYCSYWSLFMDLTKPEDRVITSVTFNLFGMLGTLLALLIVPLLEDFLQFSMIVLLVGLIYLSTVLFTFFCGPKEDLEKIKRMDEEGYKPTSLLGSLKEVLKNKNFTYYLFSAFFFTLAMSIDILIFIPYIEHQGIELTSTLIFLAPFAVFSLIFLRRLAEKWTKLKTFKLGLCVGFLIQPFIIFLGVYSSGSLLLFHMMIQIYVILFVLISIMTFSFAIMMDIVPSGKEATYSGVYLFFTVIAVPCASGILGFLLNFLKDPVFIWPAGDFAYVAIVLISCLTSFLSFLALRKIKYQEPILNERRNISI